MIQDRLTAKFKSAKPAKPQVSKRQPASVTKSPKGPVADQYTKGRRLPGSFWL